VENADVGMTDHLGGESEIQQQIEDATDIGRRFETQAQQLTATIDLGGLDRLFFLQARQHGRESRASAEARRSTSGEAAQSQDDLATHVAPKASVEV